MFKLFSVIRSRHDVLFGTVHVLGMGIMCFYDNTINAYINLQWSGGSRRSFQKISHFTNCNYKLHDDENAFYKLKSASTYNMA